MSTVKAAKVVEALAERTSEGAVHWVETQKNETFQTSLKTTSVILSRYSRSDNAYDFTIHFINEEGVVVEEVTDEELSEGWRDAYKTLVKLFDNARSQALGVDKTLDAMLKELDDLSILF